MSDDLSPIERCIQGWEMTRELLAEDMAEIRRWRTLVRKLSRVVQENGDDDERDERSAVGA